MFLNVGVDGDVDGDVGDVFFFYVCGVGGDVGGDVGDVFFFMYVVMSEMYFFLCMWCWW